MQDTERKARSAGSREKVGPALSFEYVQSVVERLRILKGGMTYAQMESLSGVHPTLLCRYVTGSTRPSREQADLLERTLLKKSGFKDKLKQKMVVAPNGYLDLHQVTGDPHALRWISAEVAMQYSKIKYDLVLTAAASGITLATAVAIQMQVPVIYATRSKSSGAGAYYEADLPSTNPSEVSTLYLPKNLIKKDSSIIIVDDVATSGRTMSGLVSLARAAGCSVSGIFVLASKSDIWKDRIAQALEKDAKISVLFDLGQW
ncbi:MAG: hypothetical protein JRN52_03325 [Nitrososphaerota archaeon]|nr:hypothetical protein [Nitrososphaerota archaeon]